MLVTLNAYFFYLRKNLKFSSQSKWGKKWDNFSTFCSDQSWIHKNLLPIKILNAFKVTFTWLVTFSCQNVDMKIDLTQIWKRIFLDTLRFQCLPYAGFFWEVGQCLFPLKNNVGSNGFILFNWYWSYTNFDWESKMGSFSLVIELEWGRCVTNSSLWTEQICLTLTLFKKTL